MRFNMDRHDIALLGRAGIAFDPNQNYSDDEAFALLDKVYDQEVFHAQSDDKENAAAYAHLADKIQNMIPDQ